MEYTYSQLVAKCRANGIDLINAIVATDDLHLLREPEQTPEEYEGERTNSLNLILNTHK